jgi:hypothetical protein
MDFTCKLLNLNGIAANVAIDRAQVVRHGQIIAFVATIRQGFRAERRSQVPARAS